MAGAAAATLDHEIILGLEANAKILKQKEKLGFFFFFFLMAAPPAYVSSWARRQFGAAAASHSSGSLPIEWGKGLNLCPAGPMVIGSMTCWATTRTLRSLDFWCLRAAKLALDYLHPDFFYVRKKINCSLLAFLFHLQPHPMLTLTLFESAFKYCFFFFPLFFFPLGLLSFEGRTLGIWRFPG